MRNFRPALLVLLTSSLASVGVPASFGQTGAASKSKGAAGKTASSKTSQSKTAPKNSEASSSGARGRASSAPSKKFSAKASSKPSTTSAKKGSGRSSKKSRKQPGQKAPTTERVSEIQAALARDGSFQGSPNGKWDDETASAMRKFQATHGLNASGKVDAPTLQRLGLGSQTAGVAAPTPPPGTISHLTSSTTAPSGSSDSRR
jgi:murein L,D-transpeptidase YcbB/YkuD